MNKPIILLSICCFFTGTIFGQKLIRSSMSTFGNMRQESGATYRQTVGQSSSTSVVSNDGKVLRQGFQQPLSHVKNPAAKEKRCTLYLNPNPATSFVYIRFNENVGENQVSVFDMMGKLQFNATASTPDYELDISNLNKGVYMVNVISKSGYFCSQKLIVN